MQALKKEGSVTQKGVQAVAQGGVQGAVGAARPALRTSSAELYGLYGLYGLCGGAVLGALGYFLIPGPLWPWLMGAVLAMGCASWRRHGGLVWGCLGVLLIGVSAEIQVRAIDTRGVPARGTYAGIGQVLSQEPVEDDWAALVRVPLRQGMVQGPVQELVQVRLRVEAPLQPGGWYQLSFWAAPVAGPLYPGGFDARFHFLFRGVQGFGRLDRAILIQPGPASMRQGLHAEGLRTQIDARIRARLPDQRGAVASAMLTGLRGSVDEETQRLFRTAGLTHLLAISGLHLSLLAGFVYSLVRGLFWAVPSLNLALDQQRVAVLAGMVAALGYFALSGGAVPTQRALVLVIAAGCALLLARQALIWRLWAFALLVVLILSPAQVFSVSTHLSFLAVAILIRVAQGVEDWAMRREAGGAAPLPTPLRLGLNVLATTGGVNLMTVPILLLVFGAAPTFGTLANLVAVPLAGAVIVPLAFVSLLAMPLGWEGAPLDLLGRSIGVLFWLAERIDALPANTLAMRASPLPLIGVLLLGYAVLLYPGWRTWRRPALGACLIVLATLTPLILPKPQQLHHPSGWILVQGPDGALKNAGARNISDFEFSRVHRLWTAKPPQEPPVVRQGPAIPNRATAETGPVLIYQFGAYEGTFPASWLQNDARWWPEARNRSGSSP